MTVQVALVTGAARGIGAAVVRRLVASGFVVVAIDSCEGSEADVAYDLATKADLDALADSTDRVTGVVADVRDPDALADAVRLANDLGPLTAVVAAAAVVDGGDDLWSTKPAVLQRLWDVDLVGVWNTAVATTPTLLATADAGGQPSFVAIASTAGHRGLWHLSAYCAVKHAVVGLVRGLAADLHGRGVTVAGVSPGSTATAMLDATAALYGLDDSTQLARTQTTGAPLDPDEVARLVETACTAGPVVHGSVLSADGGFAE
ncbi:mycofactocin-coupled SDR family oxidoreductase [Luteipulveratus halotolerans]|uniref:Oxidoreductase n=1 Tax=Luteipulveratus halotolerans TaxID=1631356 RepID=A0A0L6CJH5_9MICO|nr:mycofactocin-coupled SDR family oxidoreductase [Luteipulveratus halotolerans]KNX37894.1 hypothetical protein VV01_13180 [Luteipulveratus halotolerans]